MLNVLKIKFFIVDWVYLLIINFSQEEGFRKVIKKIEEMIKCFENSYVVRDK